MLMRVEDERFTLKSASAGNKGLLFLLMNISEVRDCAYPNNRNVRDILILNNFNILLKALSKQKKLKVINIFIVLLSKSKKELV